jgi:hypothetical protein
VTTILTLHAGHDVRYFTAGQHAGGCAGAMSYYTAAGEPPGQWAGRGAARLALSGEVDAPVIERLYGQNVGPGGELLVKRRQTKAAEDRETEAMAAYLAEHPYASAVEIAEVRAAERGKDPHSVPYFDLTVSAVKSVSVLHASYRVAARKARDDGDEDQAAELDARADEIEAALMESARETVGWLEQHATYTRTGHHSARTGEWRDGDGVVASLFLHHLSRDGDPQLHVHVAVWNRVQRADQADGKWRTLDSRTLHNQRLGVAGLADRVMETRLTRLGYAMVPRADGNGAEVGGVSQDVMDLFSSRSVAVTGELRRLAREYEQVHGKPPSRRTLWLLHQQAGQNTRRSKSAARHTLAGQTGAEEPTEAQRLRAWETQTAQREVQTLSAVHQQVRSYATDRTGPAPAVLSDVARRRAARIAAAEVQKHHATWSMAQLRFEVHRALPILPAGTDPGLLITEVAQLAVSGRTGAGVVQVTAPDVTDVTSLGVRASDGGSIYRPPQEERWCTLEHLDTEEQILTAARQPVPQLVTQEQARDAVTGTGTGLNAQQAEAVVTMLATVTATTVLIAPAGAGKSYTMAAFSGLWELYTGHRVIGLATSTNAARVLQHEGLAESYNIAEFLGKTEGSDELRRPVPLHAGDVLVLDEATQISTADLAMLQQAARTAGARIIMVGDTQQLGSPEAGGMFRLLAREVPAAELTEVRRFTSPWEAAASVRLRVGDLGVVAVYDRHGRIIGADQETAYERAATAWLADHLRGKEVLLLAGSNAEAADLARRVQAKLIQAGTVGAAGPTPVHTALADGNHAHPGDRIRARLNSEIDAGGRRLTNRDTLQITAIRGPDVQVRRQRLDRSWTELFWVPRSYLAASAELAYAGNVHVAQGRTVDTAHLLVTDTLSKQSLYVGMSRGRETNTAHVVTGNTAPSGHEPYQQAAPETVLAAVMQHDSDELSATEQIRDAQEWAGGTGHLLNLWAAAVRHHTQASIDQQITTRLSEDQAWRYQREHSRRVLHAQLHAAQLAGQDLDTVIAQITASPLDGAVSISKVLHSRLQDLRLPQQAGHDLTWMQRTPPDAPPIAHEIAQALDSRSRELGERGITAPEPWVTRHLGVLPADASPTLTEDYARRVAVAASYREAVGITNPEQAISPEPHRGNPELETMRRDVIAALEIHDNAAILAHLPREQLETLQHQGERAQATAPADVTAQLRLTAQAEDDTLRQSADAQIQHDDAQATSADTLAAQLAAERLELETGNAEYETWAAQTQDVRDTGGMAKIELQRRGQAQPDTDRQVGAEQESGQSTDPDALAEQEHQADAAVQSSGQTSLLNEILTEAANAAGSLAAERAEREASSDYVTRITRQAGTEAEAGHHAEASEAVDAGL